MKVQVAWQWQTHAEELHVEIVQGASVADLLVQLKNTASPSLLNALEQRAAIGVWGKVSSLDEQVRTILRDNDRLEIYRQLKADPKLARRQRVVAKKNIR
jgi:putative ubiquitin-RnfH superfamily antitoxin RatB of RatAB toxin-antitoxin module